MNIVIWILTVLVGGAFLFFSVVKIFGVPASVFNEQKTNSFDVYGINRTQIRLIGIMELFGGVTVWFWASQYQILAQAGLVTLMIVTLGAMYFHNRYDSLFKDGFPAVMQFVFSSIILAYTLLV